MCSSFLRALVSLEEKTGVHTHTDTHGETLCCKAVRLKQQQCVLVNYKCIFKTNNNKKKTSIGGYLGLYSTTTQENQDNF